MSRTLEECVKHFFETYDFKNGDPACAQMFSFLGIAPEIGAEWVKRSTIPKGEHLLRFQFLLGAIGYELQKPNRFSPLYDEAERQLLVKEVSIPEIAQRLNVSKKRAVHFIVNRTLITETKESLLRGLLQGRCNVTQWKFKAWQQEVESWRIGLQPKVKLSLNETTNNEKGAVMSFQGSTEKCLKHFSNLNEFSTKNRESFLNRNRICQVFGIGESSGYEWFSAQRLPIGASLVKLRLILELCGYKVTEREELPELFRSLGDQISLGVLKVTEVVEYLGVSNDLVMRVITGKRSASEDRQSKMMELLKTREEQAAAGLQGWRLAVESMGLKKPVAKPISSPLPPPPPKVQDSSRNGNESAVVAPLASLLKAALPLAEALLSDNYSPDDRRRLRELTTCGRSNVVFELSNALNRLCGERARKEIQ